MRYTFRSWMCFLVFLGLAVCLPRVQGSFISDYIFDKTTKQIYNHENKQNNLKINLKMSLTNAILTVFETESEDKPDNIYTYYFNVTQNLNKSTIDSKQFFLNGTSENGLVDVIIKTGFQWTFRFDVIMGGKNINFVGEFTEWDMLCPYILLAYCLLSTLILPPSPPSIHTLQTYPIGPLVVTHILSLSLSQLTILLISKEYNQIQRTISIICLGFILYQLILRSIVLYWKIFNTPHCSTQQIVKILLLVVGGFWAVLLLFRGLGMGMWIYFGVGGLLAGYMSLILLSEKPEKFCYRGVLTDSLTILLLAIINRIYPLLNNQISTYSAIFSIFILFVALQVYSVIIMIILYIRNSSSQMENLETDADEQETLKNSYRELAKDEYN